jgi:hypothetical protein
MKIQPHFLRLATLSASLLLIIGAAALSPVCATAEQDEAKAEQSVRLQIQNGEVADLNVLFPEEDFPKDKFPDKRRLAASFIVELLTSHDGTLRVDPHGLWIVNAVITGELDLINQEIPYEVSLINCVFEDDVDLTDSHFAKAFSLTGSTFKHSIDFSGVNVDSDFDAEGGEFSSNEATFLNMKVGRDFRIGSRIFGSRSTSFANVRVGGDFETDGSEFRSEDISFEAMRVEGTFSVQRCTFNYVQTGHSENGHGPKVSFVAARYSDVFLDGSSFRQAWTIDFSRMQTDFLSLNDFTPNPLGQLRLGRMTFKFISPTSPNKLQFLLARGDAEFYADLENSLRTHGYSEEADTVFIARKRRERDKCTSFLSNCDRGGWVWNYFQDELAGYGKKLKYLLVWSLVFLFIGMVVFRSEKGMRTQDKKDARHYYRRYCCFWYSLDLFLPIIKLGEADTWKPRDNRRWANVYRKVHIIIGSLFVPIGLAAWTGIIR